MFRELMPQVGDMGILKRCYMVSLWTTQVRSILQIAMLSFKYVLSLSIRFESLFQLIVAILS
jgi:hypothetical protein